jgi:hypothetical protein
MDEKFDIFKKLSDGQPMWVRAVDGFTEAKQQLLQLSQEAPGEYFLYNSPTGQIIPLAEAMCSE